MSITRDLVAAATLAAVAAAQPTNRVVDGDLENHSLTQCTYSLDNSQINNAYVNVHAFGSPGGIDQEGVMVLAKALRANHSLTSVGLLGCGLDEATVEMLLKLKEEKPNLVSYYGRLTPDQTEADFLHKGLGPGDAKLLAPELAVHTSLTSLDLSGNKLGPEGAKALAPGLASISLLRVNVRLNLLNVAAKEQLRASEPDRDGFELLL